MFLIQYAQSSQSELSLTTIFVLQNSYLVDSIVQTSQNMPNIIYFMYL